MPFIKCDILDNKALDIFRKIEADPDTITEYTRTEKPEDNTKILQNLETQVMHIQTKIGHLTEILSNAESSSAAKYIIAQIEKEDLDLSAARREIEVTKAAIRHEKNTARDVRERAGQIADLIHGLDGFSASEKNAVVREIVQECRWDGSEFFLRL